jgi:MSHA pilin protein MshA
VRQKHRGFTLIEIVIVIAIIGILAALGIPRFMDISGAAEAAATKAGLGTVRSTLAIRYANSATGGATASFPGSLAASDFGSNEVPKNAVNASNGVTALAASVNGTTTHTTLGFWYVSSTAGTYGQAGAYSDGTINTADY